MVRKGCGKLTYVIGTNGGKISCGSTLNMFGNEQIFYCPDCIALRKCQRCGSTILAEENTKLSESGRLMCEVCVDAYKD